ncbi:hypothetical protein M0802_015646, partial [Mischocyttarus mexicanus]
KPRFLRQIALNLGFGKLVLFVRVSSGLHQNFFKINVVCLVYFRNQGSEDSFSSKNLQFDVQKTSYSSSSCSELGVWKTRTLRQGFIRDLSEFFQEQRSIFCLIDKLWSRRVILLLKFTIWFPKNLVLLAKSL